MHSIQWRTNNHQQRLEKICCLYEKWAYIDVGIEHVLKVLGWDGGHLVDQVHQKAAHAVICCHFARLRQTKQHYLSNYHQCWIWLHHKWSLETHWLNTKWKSWNMNRKTKSRRYHSPYVNNALICICAKTHQHILNVCKHSGQHVLYPGCRASHLGQIRGKPLGATRSYTCPL